MAVTQTTILAAGKTAARSSAVSLDNGVEAVVGVFTDGADAGSENIPADARFRIVIDTPGDDMTVFVLDKRTNMTVLRGPGVYYIDRPELDASSPDIGFYQNV